MFLVNSDKQHQQTLIFKIKISFSRKLKDAIEIQEFPKNKPASAIVHVVTNDMTNDVKLLTSVRKICHKAKKILLSTQASFSSIFTEAHSKFSSQTSTP